MQRQEQYRVTKLAFYELTKWTNRYLLSHKRLAKWKYYQIQFQTYFNTNIPEYPTISTADLIKIKSIIKTQDKKHFNKDYTKIISLSYKKDKIFNYLKYGHILGDYSYILRELLISNQNKADYIQYCLLAGIRPIVEYYDNTP